MKTIKSSENSIVVELDFDELRLVNNALNEILNGIEVPEFQTRTGSSGAEAKTLLNQIGQIFKARGIEPGLM